MDFPDLPVNSEAAWRGSALRTRDDWIYVLRECEVAEICAAARAMAASGVAMEKLRAADYPFPELGKTISGWLAVLDRGRGFVLVRGLPVARMSEHFPVAMSCCGAGFLRKDPGRMRRVACCGAAQLRWMPDLPVPN